MPNEQIVMGALVALLCLAGLYNDDWFLHETRKGQRLIGWFGEETSLWVVRFLFVLGAVFGILLSTNIVQPMQW